MTMSNCSFFRLYKNSSLCPALATLPTISLFTEKLQNPTMKISVLAIATGIFATTALAQRQQIPACLVPCASIVQNAGCGAINAQAVGCLCSKRESLLAQGKTCMQQNNCAAGMYEQIESQVNGYCGSH